MSLPLFTKLLVVTLALNACSFNFELTSQRTALENQILGTYKQLDEDLVMVASVSATEVTQPSSNRQILSERHVFQRAEINRKFNSIDISELKDDQILGETWEGKLVVLPKGIGLVEQASAMQLRLAEIVTFEENRDRQIIWHKTASDMDGLSTDELDDVARIFARQHQESAKPGHWFLDNGGTWYQKTATADEN